MAIKLFYFDNGGRAEAIRLALSYGGVQFEDVRLTREEFAEKKAAGFFKFGQVPVLEINGKQFAQSSALLRWAGRQSDLYPQDPIQALKVDEALELLVDVQGKIMPAAWEQDPAKKEQIITNYLQKEVPIWFGYAEKLLSNEGTGYFAGNSPSIAGISWYIFLTKHFSGPFQQIPANLLDNYPNINKLYELVKTNPKIVEYYSTKPN